MAVDVSMLKIIEIFSQILAYERCFLKIFITKKCFLFCSKKRNRSVRKKTALVALMLKFIQIIHRNMH